MNILCLSDAFWPDHTGGISKSLLLKVEGLAQMGQHLTVVSRRLLTHHPGFESRNGYELYRFAAPADNSVFHLFYPLASFITLPRLLRQLQGQVSFDLAYVNNPFLAAGLHQALPGLRYVFHYHASTAAEIRLDAERGKYGRVTPLADRVTHWVLRVERQALSRASRVIVDSQFMAQDLLRLHLTIDPAKLVKIPLCVDTNRFCFSENTSAARPGLGWPADKFILLTVRRLVARMGIENVIGAMLQVRQRFPQVLLVIGGTGYLKQEFQELIKQYDLEQTVVLAGFIAEEKLPVYYQAADLFVLPTLTYEGFGLVTLEALASGTPVMATPTGASPEILQPLGPEFLFEDNSADGIARGLIRWLAGNPTTQIRRTCRDYCVVHFSQEQVCRDLKQVLVQAAGTMA